MSQGAREKRGEYLFRLTCAWTLLILGVIFVLFGLFNPSMPSALIFGLEFIGAAYYISQRTFKGFRATD